MPKKFETIRISKETYERIKQLRSFTEAINEIRTLSYKMGLSYNKHLSFKTWIDESGNYCMLNYPYVSVTS